MLLIKNYGHIGLIIRQNKFGVAGHLLSVYDASKLSKTGVVKSPVLSLQRAFFQKIKIFFKSENLKKCFNKKW